MNTRLRRQVVVDVGGQTDREIFEVFKAIAAAGECRRERQATQTTTGILLDVVRVDQRDGQAEWLVAVVGVQEVDGTLAILLVGRDLCGRSAAIDEAPVVIDRPTTEITEALWVAHVRRIPPMESITLRQMRDIRL